MSRPIHEISREIRADWPHMTPDAYLNLVDEMSYICSQASSTFKPDRFKEACFEESEA